jgi:hypothetical protein
MNKRKRVAIEKHRKARKKAEEKAKGRPATARR